MDKKIIAVGAILLFLWMNKKPQQPKMQFGFQVLETPEEADEELPDRTTDTGGGTL